ncbi:hypothetical protein phytr_1820 [Candidatus Phycorickettsia trachydisci]|uniref:DUF3168 domain-containing protein n=1 Tax=Candidatus Phycorickettsia trachydisci TaxID=2115978 RepID=A0A2P1P798_9RICK|nr:hypothetical protein [Candidatus Phycorickettsia trachydisci]AVP87140.1 hypothetical protein phytr_1820 [Candidatus Phycorickettsia trachydisci]
MSLSIVSNLLDSIYNLLTRSDDIINFIPQIYLAPPQNPSYPFLLLELQKVTDQNQNFEVEFNICLFYREQTPQVGISLADKIDECLLRLKDYDLGFKILGIKQQNITLSKSEDTLTLKLSIKYLSLIRKI